MFFLDSSDPAEITDIFAWGVVSGVTTNPLILAREAGSADQKGYHFFRSRGAIEARLEAGVAVADAFLNEGVIVTADGRTQLRHAEAAVREADARVLAKLSASQQREFKRMLEALGPD